MQPEMKQREIGLPAAVAVVVGNMVGTGVFTSLGFQVLGLPAGFPILLLWLVGGVVAFCGALCYAELGAALPRSGGEYHLLGRVWHPLAGFLAGWLSVTVGFAAPVALACAAFGKYLAGSVAGEISPVVAGLGLLAVATAVQLVSPGVSGRFQAVATTLKVALVLVLIVAGLAAPAAGTVSFFPVAGDGARLLSADFAVSLFFVSYSYSGWNAAVYIAGEMKDAGRVLPRALLLGTAVVAALYVAVNAAFLHSTPVALLAGKPEVGLVAAQQIFGQAGGRTMGLLISAGLVSAVSAMMWAGPRVGMAMGEDVRVLSWLGKKSRAGVPVVAVLVQAVIAAALLVWGTFEKVLVYIEFTLALSAFLTVAGVIRLRRREPALARPFRVPGWPVTPWIFLGFTLYAMIRVALARPLETSLGLATVAVGAVVWWAGRKKAA